MTTPNDEGWESEMGDVFERRVRDLHEAPLDLGAVKGTARRIRRRRRAAVAGSVLAAAAVVVPVGVLATGAGDGRVDGIDAAGPSVTVSATDPARPGDPGALGFSYLEIFSGDAVLHLADGGTITLPDGADYLGAVDLGGQVAAVRRDDDALTSLDLVEDGRVVTTYEVRGGVAVTPDQRTVGFVTTDDELLVVSGRYGETSFGTVEPDANLAALIGTGDCADEAGCHPFLEYQDGRAPYEINYEGPNTVPVPGALAINDAADGFLVTAQTASTDDGSCGVLYDRQAQRALFETCEAQVLDISPDGRHVVGTDPYGDGLGPRYFSILDAEGNEVARHEARSGYVFLGGVAWRDDSHAVASVFDGGQWQLVSLGVDGSSEVVAGPVPGDEMESPFRIIA
jgi:hypothetical protein